MKKQSIIFMMLCFITVSSVFAQSKGTLPSWMNNSVVVLSAPLFGYNITVGNLFGKKFLNSPNTTIKATENRLIISNEMIQDGIVAMRIKVTFVMNKMNDAGTCYPCEVFVESPITFASQTFSCYGGPYNNPKEYGSLLGFLGGFLEEFNQL